MASRVFVSYRREDAPGHAGRLYDGLAAHFGAEQVFVDVDNIGIGQDFVARIHEVVSLVDVVVAVIGPNWADARAPDGSRRLDDPGDFVRLEVETAIRRGVLLVPVLVEGAEMPSASDLPAEIAPLARRNACVMDDRDWRRGVERLVRAIDAVIATGQFPIVQARPDDDVDATSIASDAPQEASPADRQLIPERRIALLRWVGGRGWWNVAAGAGVVMLVVIAAVLFRSSSGGSAATSAADALATNVTAKVQAAVRGDPGATFEREDACNMKWDADKPPPRLANQIELTFPRETCTGQTYSSIYTTHANFAVIIAKDGRKHQAETSLNLASYSTPGPRGIQQSTEGNLCGYLKQYAPTVWMKWWIATAEGTPCMPPDYSHNDAWHGWDTLDTALTGAVAAE